jgi:hypothetical protein
VPSADFLICSGKQLRFFADAAAKKWPLRGSLQLGVGCL